MKNKFMNFIAHGGDYNPDQWIATPEIWDEDIRLMKLANVNCVTVGIFSWSLIEPTEGEYNLEWLDTILDKLHANGISAILATPSGARPAWLSEKYPEVLRVNENGIRNEFGVRHNHCLTSPVYREKVRSINRIIAERYKNHPAVKMWHISNEYCGDCHCELCQEAFRAWLKRYYDNDLEKLNFKWWNGFWSHRLTDWSQISSPKSRGENHSSALKLCWQRFVTDSTISFYENEIAPLREITPDIPITTNFMRMYDGLDYQKFANHLDLISWDSYPAWGTGNDIKEAYKVAFCHDTFRSMKDGQPFFLMESTPSTINWSDVNKLPKPSVHQLSALQSVAHGADSVLYFQWRKARGGHEKFHGAVVDHCGHENTRVFKNVTETGRLLSRLSDIVGEKTTGRVAIVYDWENSWAVKHYCGYNNIKRDYFDECAKWYKPFWEKGINVDIIAMDSDFGKYDLIIAPYLYMLKDGTEAAIEGYVKNGGKFVATYLTGIVDKDDLCFLGGFPANSLKDVFGVCAEETDSLPEGITNSVQYNSKEYTVKDICDILNVNGAEVLGEYQADFYKNTPAVTVNNYGKGKAYYVSFGNDGDFFEDFTAEIIKENGIKSDTPITAECGVEIRKRGKFIFVLNFSDEAKAVALDREYFDTVNENKVSGEVILNGGEYLVLE